MHYLLIAPIQEYQKKHEDIPSLEKEIGDSTIEKKLINPQELKAR